MSDAESIAVLSAKVERLEALLLSQGARLERVAADLEAARLSNLPRKDRRQQEDSRALDELVPLLLQMHPREGVFTSAGLLRDESVRSVLPERLHVARALGHLFRKWEESSKPIKYHSIRRQSDSGRDSEGAVWYLASVFSDTESQKHTVAVAN